MTIDESPAAKSETNEAHSIPRFIGKNRSEWQPFSIVIPAHNESKYLPVTLAELKKSIAAIQAIATLIVVDDDSKDDTAEIAKKAGAKLISVNLRNIGAVRNAGAAVCETDWLFFLDADTVLPPETLAKSLDLLASGAAGGGAHVSIPQHPKVALSKMLIFYAVKVVWQFIGGWAAGCYMFCRKDVFVEFGGFDEQYFAAEEWFFSREVRKRGRFSLIRDPVVTSARKLHNYSVWQLLRFVTLPILRPTMLFKSKLGLELLYDDERAGTDG